MLPAEIDDLPRQAGRLVRHRCQIRSRLNSSGFRESNDSLSSPGCFVRLRGVLFAVLERGRAETVSPMTARTVQPPRAFLMPPMALNRDEDPIAQGEAAAHGSDLGRLLRWRAMQAPDRIAYRFVRDADGEASVLTYRQLDRHARHIAACIQFFHPAGSHALVLYPPSLDYVAALFGCFYAGVVAVPANWPRRARDLQRLEGVISHAAVDFVLSSADGRNALARRSIGAAVLDSISVITTDQLSAGSERDWVEPSCASRSLALLQYTSGSTGSPKGVMISHGNIIDNVSHLVARADLSPASIDVSWLPPFHDMGLMGGVIAPLYAGFPVTLMSPASFVSHPLIWLQAITRYRGTVSVAPNFGYELCLAKVQAEQMAELDLSPWA